jgi:hypothetical protein
MKDLVRPWAVVTVIVVIYLAVIIGLSGGSPLSLAYIAGGYDGQFAYQIARDPANGWRLCDVPAYRYQRILYPLLAWALALGRKELIPWTLPLINVAALAAGTTLTERFLLRREVSRWYALTYGLYAGQLLAARLDLAEPLSQAFIAAAVLLGDDEKWGWSAVCFALAVLSKETALVFAAGYGLYLLIRWEKPGFSEETRFLRRWRTAIIFGTIVGLPFSAWQIVLKLWLGSFGVGPGGTGATGWEIIPLRGLWSMGAQFGLITLAAFALIMVPLAVIPALLSLWLGYGDLRQRGAHPVTLALLMNALMVMFVPQSTFREPAGMLRLLNGLVVATVLHTGLRRNKRGLRYTLLWLASNVFLLKESQPISLDNLP